MGLRQSGGSGFLRGILVLGLLLFIGGMIWLDRQSNRLEKEVARSQTEQVVSTQESTGQTLGEATSDTEDSSADTSRVSEEAAPELAETAEWSRAVVEGLSLKDNPEALVSQAGTLTLRSMGSLEISPAVAELADRQNPLMLAYIQAHPLPEGQEEAQIQNGYTFLPMFQEISPFVSYADITLANLTMPVAYPQLPLGQAGTFNAPKALLTNLQFLGTDMVTNAAIGIGDQGDLGIQATYNNIQEAGLMSVGLFPNLQVRNQGVTVELNGIRLGFLSYSPVDYETVPGDPTTAAILPLPPEIPAEIATLRSQVDAVVVSIQFNDEVGAMPSEVVRQAFSTLAEAGATLILGNNSSMVQPLEWLNEGNTLAVYSQGAILNGNQDLAIKQSGILEVTFKREGEEVKISQSRFMPTVVLGQGDETFLQVVPLADYQRYVIEGGEAMWEDLSRRLRSYSEEIAIVAHLETALSDLDIDTHR